MKTRSILPFAVFGLLLALLLALSACGGDYGPSVGGPGGTPTPTPGGPSDEFSRQVGGPYSFALEGEEAGEKEREIECSKELGLSLSEAVKLEADLFNRSISANKVYSDGTDAQKYNFVIKVIDENDETDENNENDKNVEIIVAQWKEGNDQLDGDKKVSEKCRCRIDNRWGSGLGAADTMVDLFPEGKDAGARKSPCWLDSDRKDGLLDAISKHFMLAQGAGRTIDDFGRNRWYEWRDVKVLYAGEFFVDVENSCISDVNGDSGTYRPKKRSYQPLKSVLDQFSNQLPGKIC